MSATKIKFAEANEGDIFINTSLSTLLIYCKRNKVATYREDDFQRLINLISVYRICQEIELSEKLDGDQKEQLEILISSLGFAEVNFEEPWRTDLMKRCTSELADDDDYKSLKSACEDFKLQTVGKKNLFKTCSSVVTLHQMKNYNHKLKILDDVKFGI